MRERFKPQIVQGLSAPLLRNLQWTAARASSCTWSRPWLS